MGVAVIVNGREDWKCSIELALRGQFLALNMAPEAFPALSGLPELEGEPPLILFLQPPLEADGAVASLNPIMELRLKNHLNSGFPVLPVVPTPKAAEALPALLAPLNAFVVSRHGARWPDVLAEELLTRLWLHRRSKHIFISYKRTDSQAIARQLRELLSGLGFEVFLDESGLQFGDDFQRGLHSRLVDSDLVLLLHSPKLTNSSWAMEEVHTARYANIGFLALKWPEVSEQDPVWKAFGLHEQLELEPAAFRLRKGPADAQLLHRRALDRVLEHLYRVRVGATVRRLQNLLPYARYHYGSRFLVQEGQRLGDLQLHDGDSLDGASGREQLARVLPFRPTLESIHALVKHARVLSPVPAEARCFYQESDPKHSGLASLQWALGPSRPGERPERVHIDPFIGSRR